MARKGRRKKRDNDDVPLFDRCRMSRGTDPNGYFDADPRYDRDYGEDDECLAEAIEADPDLRKAREAALELESDDEEDNA